MQPEPLRWALVIPLANEERTLPELLARLARVFDAHPGGRALLVVDRASKDRTRDIAEACADPRFQLLWAPENRNVVDAYLRGHREALRQGAEWIIEMDGGLSHQPEQIPRFLQALGEGCPVVYGSRAVPGGSFGQGPRIRRWYSHMGTLLSNLLLGMRFADGTSGFIGFSRPAAEHFSARAFLSTGHFYQTELRYYLKGWDHNREIPISYVATVARVSRSSLGNALKVLLRLFLLRIRRQPANLA